MASGIMPCLQVPALCEFLYELFLVMKVIWNFKPNKPFPLQLALVMVFLHSNTNLKYVTLQITFSILIFSKVV